MKKSTCLIPRSYRSVPCVLVILGVFFLSGCFESDVVPPTMDEIRAEQLPDQESWFATFDVLNGTMPRLKILADYIAKYEETDSTYMILKGHPDSLNSRVTAFVFDEKGDSSATIRANNMVYFEDDRRFEAHGNVIVDTHDKKRLETEFLIWLEVERKVQTEGFVRINSPTENIQGYNLDADEDLENYQIARVTGKAVVEDL